MPCRSQNSIKSKITRQRYFFVKDEKLASDILFSTTKVCPRKKTAMENLPKTKKLRLTCDFSLGHPHFPVLTSSD